MTFTRRQLLAMLGSAAAGARLQAQQVPPQSPIRVGKDLLGVGTTNPGTSGPSGQDAFFDDSVLQEIRLQINTRDWETLKQNFQLNDYYPCTFVWRGQTTRNVGIRSRGTGSRSGVKPGLRVDFDRYTTSQKFLGLKSFILRNNTQDASNLHERLSMLLYRRLGVPASREAHARMYVNDEYAGLYSIVESVDKAFVARNLGEDNGYLYEYSYPSTAAPYYFEDRGSDPNTYVPLPFKPETHEDDPKPEFIVQLVQAINQSSDFRGAIAEFLDLQKFLRHVAVESFVTDYDGFNGNWGMNNFYFYRYDNQRKFAFIPWDKSQAFLGGYTLSIWRNITDVPSAQRNRLMARVLSYPDLYNYYLDTIIECANSAEDTTGSTDGKGWLEREVQREYDQVHEAALADPDKPFSNADFEQAISDLFVFSRERGERVRREVADSRR
jgi:spore coat protein H